MDTNLYYWWVNQNTQRNRQWLRSAIEMNEIFSMAQLGSLSSLKFGEKNIYYRGRGHTAEGSVLVPKELEKLLQVSVVQDADVWLNDNFPRGIGGKEHGLRIQLRGDFYTVSCIWIWYGFESGVLALEFDGTQHFICDIPKGFDLDSLVILLNAGEEKWEEFVLANGKLNQKQQTRLREVGLDGLGGKV